MGFELVVKLSFHAGSGLSGVEKDDVRCRSNFVSLFSPSPFLSLYPELRLGADRLWENPWKLLRVSLVSSTLKSSITELKKVCMLWIYHTSEVL